MYYHYNIVQQLKHLHDATLRPALYEEMDPLAYGSVAKSERSGGKKGDDKTGGRRSEDKGRKGDHEKGSGSSSRKGEEKKGSKEKKKLKEGAVEIFDLARCTCCTYDVCCHIRK